MRRPVQVLPPLAIHGEIVGTVIEFARPSGWQFRPRFQNDPRLYHLAGNYFGDLLTLSERVKAAVEMEKNKAQRRTGLLNTVPDGNQESVYAQYST